MPRVFHWNLENFSGRNIERNTSFSEALRDVPEDERGDIVVAGFTEVRTDHNTAYANLHEIAATLRPGVALRLLLIDVGTMAGGHQEFAGIAWSNEVNVHFAGVVMPGADAHGHEVLFADPNEAGFRIDIRADVDGDVRGIAFVAGDLNGTPYIFGFMHNVYTNKVRRAFNSQLLPSLVNRLKSELQTKWGYVADQVILAGDFNVEPPVRHSPYSDRRTLFVRAPVELDAAAGAGEVPMDGGAEVPMEIAYAKTTAVHTYDYFYVSDNTIRDDAATAYQFTRQEDRTDRTRPDHAAISLLF